jgi:sterol desaturase/sphingolipid hydroxylase (fatty acid hydroxylase superfamily)
MGLVALEHGKFAYWTDFVLHGAVVGLLCVMLVLDQEAYSGLAALGLVVASGYLAYGLAHHAAHHWRMPSAWMQRQKRWHALHHHRHGGACYGVSTGLWDRLFGGGPER